MVFLSQRMGGNSPSSFSAFKRQQFTGIQGFPAVAGALAQLVQLDLAAAEMALLTLLNNLPWLGRWVLRLLAGLVVYSHLKW